MYELSGWKFDKTVSDVFDLHVRQSIPLYESIQSAVLHLSDFFIKPGSTIYDIGCATGQTIFNVSRRHRGKELRFIGIDSSQSMIEKAVEKNRETESSLFIPHTAQDYIFPEKSNLIFSVLTLQFLQIGDRKAVLQKIFDNLYEGGALVLVEKTYATSPQTQDIFTQIYHDYKEAEGLTPVEIREKDKSLRGVMDLLSVEENIKNLRDAGFRSVDTFFKYLNFTGFLAIK